MRPASARSRLCGSALPPRGVLTRRSAAYAVWCSWLAFGRVCYDAEFLQIYFMLTMIIALLTFGLGTKKEGEKSAYSVFNRGMGSLAGTFGAQDFERHLRSQEKVQKDFTEALSTSDEDEDAVGTLKTIGKRKKARRKAALHTGGHTLGGGGGS